jgi:adenine deaminase
VKVNGNIVDIENKLIFKGEITVENGIITKIVRKEKANDSFILPGFVDAHIHIESSMLVPSEFARIAVVHGTVATVSDPHEIANVLGIDGVHFMINNGKKTPFKFNFGAPSCVPATSFESAGAVIDSEGVKELLSNSDILYLTEMMNYPGVLFEDAEVMKKISWAKHFDKPVDGHAPGLRGENVRKYIAAGISTDHECFTSEEASEKLANSMKILIREGSAAKNFDALIGLAHEHFENMMFCSDDKHPDDLILGHINELVKRGLAAGIDLFKLLKMACVNPVKHYKLKVGLLNVGDPADFIVVNDLEDFKIEKTFINGECVSENGVSTIGPVDFEVPNNFNTNLKVPIDFELVASSNQIKVIQVLDGQLITKSLVFRATIEKGKLVSNTALDVLKIVVVNRYKNAAVAVGFIHNFGLKSGAIASSVAHDSHNIIAVGVNDDMICNAVNAIINEKGGICAVTAEDELVLGLPVAGIMSKLDVWQTGELYQQIDQKAKAMGSKLHAPFMSLSFMALLVIPSLKLSDFGLFDGDKFEFTEVNHV